MIKQKLTYYKPSFQIKSYKEYLDNTLIKVKYYNEQGKLIYSKRNTT